MMPASTNRDCGAPAGARHFAATAPQRVVPEFVGDEWCAFLADVNPGDDLDGFCLLDARVR